MRKRTLLAGLLLVGAVIFFGAPAAHAQEGEEGEYKTHVEEECAHRLAEGAKLTDCDKDLEAPSPILPATDELLWGSITFVVLFGLIWKFGFPAIKKGMDARTEKIRGDLQAAEDQRNDSETVLAEYRSQLNDARAEAGRIIEESRQAADSIKRDQEARLQTELAEMRQRAVADIESAKAQAMADLRGEVAQIAIGAAETVVRKNLDTATQNRLVDEYIDQVASRSS